MREELKRPLKVTGITVIVGIVLVIAGSLWILNQKISDRKKEERILLLGSGLGAVLGLVVAPFWFRASLKIRKGKLENQETPR